MGSAIVEWKQTRAVENFVSFPLKLSLSVIEHSLRGGRANPQLKVLDAESNIPTPPEHPGPERRACFRP